MDLWRAFTYFRILTVTQIKMIFNDALFLVFPFPPQTENLTWSRSFMKIYFIFLFFFSSFFCFSQLPSCGSSSKPEQYDALLMHALYFIFFPGFKKA